MEFFERRRFFIEPKIQGGMMLRMATYCVCYMVSTAAIVSCFRIATGPVGGAAVGVMPLWAYLEPALIGAALLLPVVLFDTLCYSHRLLGPLHRMRAQMRAIARGERVEPLRFRAGDPWHDLAEDFNAMLASIDARTRRRKASDLRFGLVLDEPESESSEAATEEDERVMIAGRTASA